MPTVAVRVEVRLRVPTAALLGVAAGPRLSEGTGDTLALGWFEREAVAEGEGSAVALRERLTSRTEAWGVKEAVPLGVPGGRALALPAAVVGATLGEALGEASEVMVCVGRGSEEGVTVGQGE